MKTRDDLPLTFENFHKIAITKFDAKFQVLQLVNRGEYVSKEFQSYMAAN